MYVLIPINSPAPPVPIALYLHDGTSDTFSSDIVRKHWNCLLYSSVLNNIRLTGFSSDGAPSNRNAYYNMCMVQKWLKYEEVVTGKYKYNQYIIFFKIEFCL